MKLNKLDRYNRTYHVAIKVDDKKLTEDICFKIKNGTLFFRSNRYKKWTELCEIIYFKDYCYKCSHPLRQKTVCRAHRPDREYLDRTLAIGVYYQMRYSRRNYLSELILMLKNSIYLALILGAGIAYIIDTELGRLSVNDIDVITFVPKKKDEYKTDVDTGVHYNQSEILSRIVANILKKPIMQLAEKKYSFSLHGLSEEERWKIAKNGYYIKNCELLSNYTSKRVAIVDDVRTSGSTGNAIAMYLKQKCRADKVYLLVAGRAYFI